VTPFCSVVVPTYQRPQALARCLESLAELDYPRDRYEVVVVDDGGTSPPDVEAFRARLDLTVVAQPNAGPAAARNRGVESARGDLLAFTDDDCRPEPDWLRRLADGYVARPDEATGGRVVNALTRNPYAATAQLIADVGYRQNNEGPPDRAWFTTNNLAVPVAGFRELGGFDPAFRTAEDREFCTRWVKSGLRMSYDPDAVVRHENDLTLAGFARMNFAYGRGAHRYRASQRRRGREVPIEPDFYAALLRTAWERDRGARRARTTALLGLWHAANTAGYLWEASAAARRP
jgi:glycosyltransferase involved in cell wall biosynthesis